MNRLFDKVKSKILTSLWSETDIHINKLDKILSWKIEIMYYAGQPSFKIIESCEVELMDYIERMVREGKTI